MSLAIKLLTAGLMGSGFQRTFELTPLQRGKAEGGCSAPKQQQEGAMIHHVCSVRDL